MGSIVMAVGPEYSLLGPVSAMWCCSDMIFLCLMLFGGVVVLIFVAHAGPAEG